MPSGTHNGWYNDRTNNRLDFYYRGTRVGHINSSGLTGALAIAATTTITAGTGAVTTTGNTTTTAGDIRVTAGNLRLGAVQAFGTTEPTSAAVMMVGTAPSGAITTSGGVFTDGITVKKIIAAGTVSDIQT